MLSLNTCTHTHLLQATRGLTADESDRLMAALDTEGDGKLAYRELLSFVLQRMGSWGTRLPDLAADLAWQLAEAAGGARSATQNLRRRLAIADSSQEGRLPPAVLGRCLRSVGLGLSEQQLSELVSVLDSHGDGRVPYAALLEFCEAQSGGGGGQRRGSSATGASGSSSSAQHRLESALRDAVWRAAAPSANSSGSSSSSGSVSALRRVFDRYLDTDGDGFITVQDLGAALPELGVTRLGTSAQELSALLTAMDSRHRSLGQVSFKDFSDFMRGTSSSSGEPLYSTAGAADRSAEARRQARLGAAAASRSGTRRQSISAHSVALAPQLRDLKKVLGLNGGAESVTAAAARRALLVYDPSRSGRLPFSK
jgi:Ca2+-binding EF-hand superfamily protein